MVANSSSRVPRLTVEALSFRRKNKTLLENISLSSSAENCTAVIGPNGSGKSTFLKLCHGLLRPSSGEIRWGDVPLSQHRPHIAMAFQKPEFLRRSALANISFVLRKRGVASATSCSLARKMLAAVGMENCASQLAVQLSGGEQQRLGIARACAVDPDILLLDEPTSEQDASSARKVEALIQSLKGKGTRILVATHNLAQVRRLCDEVLYFSSGKLLVQSSCSDFFERLKGEEFCDFLFLQSLA